MIRHVVLFRYRPDATADQLARAGRELLALRGRIPEIRAIAYGRNLAPSAAEWPWVLTVELDDMAAVQRYADHPAHVACVRDAIAPIREARLAVDVEL
jgi:hypothetical protein